MSIQGNTKINVDLGNHKKRLDKASPRFDGASPTAIARMLILRGLDDIEAGRITYNPSGIVSKESKKYRR